MSGLVNISDYYLQDVPMGTLFLPLEVTSTASNERPLPGQLLNRTKWHFHEKTPCMNLKICSGHNHTSFLGKGLKALVYARPDERILHHWAKSFGNEYIPDFAEWGTQGYTVVKFPTEELPAHHHSVDPDIHYKINSKRFIGEIDVPQAKILDDFQSPCVVKATHGSEGTLVRVVTTRKEFDSVLQDLQTNVPNCDIVITEFIQGVAITYCSHCYVTKKGQVQWIGAIEQYLAGLKPHGNTEYVVKIEEQHRLRELLYPLCKAVGVALHREGYFGYCGTDIVVDADNNPFVVDINPRVNGSTTLILSTYFLNKKKGYTVGSYRREIYKQEVNLEKLIKNLENVKKGMAVLVYIVPEKERFFFGIRVYSHSEDMCNDIFKQIEYC